MARMFLSFLNPDPDALCSAEESAFKKLSVAHRRLVSENGRVNTKSEPGYTACLAFLDRLASISSTMKLEPTPRSYRWNFTVNYRALFPDGGRHYRVDILEASIEQYAAIWVNGDKFEFSMEAMKLAGLLQKSWYDLGGVLDRYCRERSGAVTCLARSELRALLVAFDAAWANFEQVYIIDLIRIEEKARQIIVQAIAHEHSLRQLEEMHANGGASSSSDCLLAQRRLVTSLARLNSVANIRRKGRDDLDVEVLTEASTALRRCAELEFEGEMASTVRAARILATDVVESFEGIRAYLRDVENCLERVDPHLCNNPGLVERLADWEESWEVGVRYVQHTAMLDAVCDLVGTIHDVQRLVPSLTRMCDECDVELFMVLPRILWLRFLASPDQQTHLLNSLLPHRVCKPKVGSRVDLSSVHTWHPDLRIFYRKFWSVIELLAGDQGSDIAETTAVNFLMKRAVLGNWEVDDICEGQRDGYRSRIRIEVESFMHELERWSMEMQRHCPEDWNQCSAILVQCLSGVSAQNKVETPFQI